MKSQLVRASLTEILDTDVGEVQVTYNYLVRYTPAEPINYAHHSPPDGEEFEVHRLLTVTIESEISDVWKPLVLRAARQFFWDQIADNYERLREATAI